MATGGVKETDRLSDETFDLLCSVCKKKNKTTEAAKFCVDCRDYYCSNCVKFHDDVPALSTHKILDRGQFQPGPGQVLQMVPTERCDRHSHKHVDMYCQNHDDVGCSTCIAVDHKHCRDTFYIPDFLQNNKDTSASKVINKKLETTEKLLTDKHTNFKQEKKRLLKSKDLCFEAIKEFRKDINQRLDVLEQNSVKAVEATYKPKLDNLDEQMTNIQKKQVKISSAKDDLSNAGNNESQMFVSTKKGKNVADNVMKFTADLKEEIKGEDIKFVTEPNLMSMLTELNLLGHLEEIDTRTQSKNECNNDIKTHQSTQNSSRKQAARATQIVSESDIKTQSKDKHNNNSKTHQGSGKKQAATPTQKAEESATRLKSYDGYNNDSQKYQSTQNSKMQDVSATQKVSNALMNVKNKKKYNIRIPSDKNTNNIHSACILDDGTIILADRGNNKLKCVDSSYTVTDYCTVSGALYQVCKISNHEVAVSCGYSSYIQFVSLGSKMVPTKQIETDHRCDGLAYAAGQLYISDNTSVYIHTVLGSKLQQYKKDQSGQRLFSDTFSLAVSNDCSKIYVVDRYSGLISLDRNGKVLGKYNGPELEVARDVCITNNGGVLVCGYGSKNVLQFTPDCKKIGEVLKCDAACSSVCYNSEQCKLIVGCYDDSIDVYEVV